ncbi:hypothetical protein SNEBB_000033 [Seison nebaliae]|nr:hypothetical protein SNEBB_000033 [Seison nebaliae]
MVILAITVRGSFSYDRLFSKRKPNKFFKEKDAAEFNLCSKFTKFNCPKHLIKRTHIMFYNFFDNSREFFSYNFDAPYEIKYLFMPSSMMRIQIWLKTLPHQFSIAYDSSNNEVLKNGEPYEILVFGLTPTFYGNKAKRVIIEAANVNQVKYCLGVCQGDYVPSVGETKLTTTKSKMMNKISSTDDISVAVGNIPSSTTSTTLDRTSNSIIASTNTTITNNASTAVVNSDDTVINSTGIGTATNTINLIRTKNRRFRPSSITERAEKISNRKGLVIGTTLLGGILVLIVLFASGIYLIKRRTGF